MTLASVARDAAVLAAALAWLGTAAAQGTEPMKALSSNGVRAALDIPSDLTPFALVPCGTPDGEVNAQGPSRFDASRVHER